MEFAKEMGIRIAKLRGNVSQQTVADAIGVRRETVRQWENAERQIKAADLLRLADYFGVSVDYVLGRTKTKSLNEDIQMICCYTELSEKAVDEIAHNYALSRLINLMVDQGISGEMNRAQTWLRKAVSIVLIQEQMQRRMGRMSGEIDEFHPAEPWYIEQFAKRLPSVDKAIASLYFEEKKFRTKKEEN